MKHVKLVVLVLLLFGIAGIANSATSPCLSFDGSDDYVDCGSGASLNISSGSITLEAWVYLNNTTTSQIIFAQSVPSGKGKLTVGYWNTNNQILIGDATSRIGVQNARNYLTAGQWQHWAVVYNFTTNTGSFYLNGTSLTVVNCNDQFTPQGTTFRLGARQPGTLNSYFLNGKMDEVRFWKVARTQTEIQQNMNHELSAPLSSNLVGYWKLNGTSPSQTATDGTSNNNTGTLYPAGYANGPQWSTGPVLYDYPPAQTTTFSGITLTINTSSLGGGLDYVSPSTPPIPNPSFVTGSAFALSGTGSFTFDLTTTDGYGAYYQSGAWHNVTASGGKLSFNIDFDVAKQVIQFVSGNQDVTLPVELSSFTAILTADFFVKLHWVTQSETGVSGFYVYRGTSASLDDAILISPMIDATNTTSLQEYEYTDSELFEPGTYYYWLQVQDMDGGVTYHGPTTVYFDNSGNSGIPGIPVRTGFTSVYPNPFNPRTTISYGITKAGDVSFKIYNQKGQLVKSYNEAQKAIGYWKLEWDGTDLNGRSCPSGIYFVKMHSGNEDYLTKAVLLK